MLETPVLGGFSCFSCSLDGINVLVKWQQKPWFCSHKGAFETLEVQFLCKQFDFLRLLWDRIETVFCDLLPEDFSQLRLQLLPFVIDISMLFVRGEDDLAVGGKQDKRRETTYGIQVRCRGVILLWLYRFVQHGPRTRVLPKCIMPGSRIPVCWDADDE